jgi:hypothetical protein
LWSLSHSNNTNSILYFFESSEILSDVVTETKKKGSSIFKSKKYILPTTHHFKDLVIKYTKLPNICISEPVDDQTLDENLKDSLFSETGISKSQSFKSMLNIANSKRFSINKSYLLLLSELSHSSECLLQNISFHARKSDVEFPFMLAPDYFDLEKEKEEFSSLYSLDTTQRYLLDELFSKAIGLKVNNLDMSNLKSSLGITSLENSVYVHSKAYKLKFHVEMMRRKYAASCITIAQCYQDHPIYIYN